jgi:hypothetical protein
MDMLKATLQATERCGHKSRNIHHHHTTVLIPIKASHPMVLSSGACYCCQEVGFRKGYAWRGDLTSFNIRFQSSRDSYMYTYFGGVSGTFYSAPEQVWKVVQVVRKINSYTDRLTYTGWSKSPSASATKPSLTSLGISPTLNESLPTR